MPAKDTDNKHHLNKQCENREIAIIYFAITDIGNHLEQNCESREISIAITT